MTIASFLFAGAGCAGGRATVARSPVDAEATTSTPPTTAPPAPTTTTPRQLGLEEILQEAHYPLAPDSVRQFARIETPRAVTYIVSLLPYALDVDAAARTIAYVEAYPEHRGGAMTIDPFGEGSGLLYNLQQRDPPTRERYLFAIPEGTDLPPWERGQLPAGRSYGITFLATPSIGRASTLIRLTPSPTQQPTARSANTLFGIELCQSAMNMALDAYARPTVPRGTASLQAMEVVCNTMGQLIGARQSKTPPSQIAQSLTRPVALHNAEKPYQLLPFDAAVYDEVPATPVFS